MAEGATPAERTTGGKEAPGIPGVRQAAVAKAAGYSPRGSLQSRVFGYRNQGPYGPYPRVGGGSRTRERAQRPNLEERQDRYERANRSLKPYEPPGGEKPSRYKVNVA